MMPRSLLLLFLAASILFASNFSDGMRAFRSGEYTKAKAAFEMAIEEDDAVQAHYFLGLIYLQGLGVPKNLRMARKHLEEAVEVGNARARCRLAEVYLLTKKRKEAVALLKQGSDNGAQECAKIAEKYKISL